MKKDFRKPNRIQLFLAKILASRKFFFVIIGVSVLQALWYVLSYVPAIFDEGYHIGVIRLYVTQWSPIISGQNTEWDFLGAVTRSSSYLYHYILSFPLRLLQLFTDNQTLQILFLRGLNIGMFVGGLIIFWNILTKYTKVHRSVIHVALLFFVMIPVVAPLVGAVNYDNMVFLLFAVSLRLALQTIYKPNIKSFGWLVIVGLIGALVKFYFLGLFAPLLLFVLYSLYKNDGRRIFCLFKSQFINTTWVFRIATISLFLLLMGLFIERPVMNFVRFGAFEPQCEQVISVERCKANYTAARNIAARNNKDPNFEPKNIASYSVSIWSPIIVKTQVNILYWKKALPIIKYLYLLFAIVTICLITVYFRLLYRSKTYRLFMVVMSTYTLILVVYLYRSYVTFAEPVAISSRYLIPIMPLFMFFTAYLATKFLKNYPKLLMGLFVLTCLLFLQGGSMTSFIVNNDDSLTWNNSTVKKINQNAQQVLGKFIINNN